MKSVIGWMWIYYNNSGRNSPMGARSCQPTAGLTFTTPQAEVTIIPLLNVVSTSNFSAVVGFIDRNYSCKSVSS